MPESAKTRTLKRSESTLGYPPVLDTSPARQWQKRRHLLDTSDLSVEEVQCLFSMASWCKRWHGEKNAPMTLLQRARIANVFYENSTRTRSSFELAARNLGATVLNLEVASSSVAKGESPIDTSRTLMAMGIDTIIQRHKASGSAHQLAAKLGNSVHVINAGDGWNAHPTQALLDLFTMLAVHENLQDRKVAIIGDIRHSRVARSNLWLLKKFGANIHVSGPPSLVPHQLQSFGVHVHTDIRDALADADFVMALRMQFERQQQGLIPSVADYVRHYRLDHERMSVCSPQVRLFHPGPVNRGIEVTDALASDQSLSLIDQQVTHGIAIRMAVLLLLHGDLIESGATP